MVLLLVLVLPQIFIVALSPSSLLPVSTPGAVIRGGSWGAAVVEVALVVFHMVLQPLSRPTTGTHGSG